MMMDETLTSNEVEELLQRSGANCTVDYTWVADGNLERKTVTPMSGPSETWTYAFDALNRLREVVTPSTTKQYGYDHKGQRVYETDGASERWYVFDGLNVIAELDGTRAPASLLVPGVLRTRLDLDRPLTEWYLQDGLGSNVQLTDDWGNLTQEYFYEPFGSQQFAPQPDRFNRYRYVGLASDDTTGLVYMNARWYDPRGDTFRMGR